MKFFKNNLIKITSYIIRKLINLPINASIIIINGGLGNQLFQYSLALYLKNKYQKNIFLLDIRKEYKIHHKTVFTSIFKSQFPIIKQELIPKLLSKTVFSKKFLSLNKLFFSKTGLIFFPLLVSDHPIKNRSLENYLIKSNYLSIFMGTWHTTINNYDEDILKFTYNNKFYIPNNYKKLFNSNFISIHLRRGDYVKDKKTARYHGNLKLDYFIESIQYIRLKYANLPVYIFTDDPIWAKNNIIPKINNSYLISSKNQSAEIDFFLMSKGKYFIISNSTFSWWAAFFSRDKEKFIILPKQWTSEHEINSNLIYKNWRYKLF